MKTPSRPAFTLVETLVVLSIISLVLAILLPALDPLRRVTLRDALSPVLDDPAVLVCPSDPSGVRPVDEGSRWVTSYAYFPGTLMDTIARGSGPAGVRKEVTSRMDDSPRLTIFKDREPYHRGNVVRSAYYPDWHVEAEVKTPDADGEDSRRDRA